MSKDSSQSLTSKGFIQELETDCMYSYASLLKYFWAPDPHVFQMTHEYNPVPVWDKD